MTALNINTYFGCKTCEAANKYGNGCNHGLLFPVLLTMANKTKCPNYKFKNKEI